MSEKSKQAFKKRYKKRDDGKYNYTPSKQVMFGRDVEDIFEKESKTTPQEDR